MPKHQSKHAKHNKRKEASTKQGRGLKRKVPKTKADTDVFKRRKFIRNNHVEAGSEEEEETSGEEEEKEDTGYGKLLQVFGNTAAGKTAIDSEEEEKDEDGEEEVRGEESEEDESPTDSVIGEAGLEAENERVKDSEDEGEVGNLDEEDTEEDVEAEDQEEEGGDDSAEETAAEETAAEETAADPFSEHVDTEISPEVLKVLAQKNRWKSSTTVFPQLGNLQVQSVDIAGQTPSEPTVRATAELHLKQKLETNLPEAGELGARGRELLSLLASYRDVCYTERSYEEAEQLRLAYCVHAVNHVLKTRTRILNNNAKHEARESGEEKLRDQGFTRPKVLIVVPFKEAARRVVECIISLLHPHNKGNVSNRKRFNQDYAKIVTARKDKSEDYYNTFEGDIDDSFKLGLAVTKSTLKLYTDFYSSDIIISSPLGLRLVTGVEGQEEEEEGRRAEGDTDFLSSLELLVLDQSDVFLMQNWAHVTTVISQLHRQPKDSHGVDFSRVRLWCLDGHSKHYRQTVLLSGLPAPELNTVWNSHCVNYRGKVRVSNPVEGVGALARVLSDTPVVWHRIDASSVSASMEARFKYLTEKIMPQFSRDSMDHTLVFIPSYFDFVKVRNWFKSSDLDFSEISEYSKDKKVAKARDEFYHNEKHFLLYTERAHYYRRFRVKGIRHLIFFQPPAHPGTLSEICSLQQSCFQNARGGSSTNMSCTVLYTKYDTVRVGLCVGSNTAATMLRAESAVHRFQPQGSS